MFNTDAGRFIVRYANFEVSCQTASDALALIDAIQGRHSANRRSNGTSKNGLETKKGEAKSAGKAAIGGSSAKLLQYLLGANKPVPESDLMRVSGLTDKQKFAGVKTGLLNALKHAEIDPNKALSRTNTDQGDRLYSVNERYAARIKQLLPVA